MNECSHGLMLPAGVECAECLMESATSQPKWEIDGALSWEEAIAMAAEGWELVNVLVHHDPEGGLNREYWFKRPALAPEPVSATVSE